MKRIGLIGGLSPESTVHYYQILCREYNRTFGGLNFPEIVLTSLNLQQLVTLFENNRWDRVAAILLTAMDRLRNAGADFAAILANTPHNAFEYFRDSAPLEILTIMDATAGALRRDGRRNVALLGTKATMEFGFFQKHFAACGIETQVPEPSCRDELDRMIWEELSHGLIQASSRETVTAMLRELEHSGVESVILGCTELSLLIKAQDTPLPLYDTTQIHAEAILEFALRGQATADDEDDLPEPSSPVCYLKDFIHEYDRSEE